MKKTIIALLLVLGSAFSAVDYSYSPVLLCYGESACTPAASQFVYIENIGCVQALDSGYRICVMSDNSAYIMEEW